MFLYDVYKRVSKNPDSLDQFINYSNQILSDFNIVDRYLLDTKHLIFDLKSISEIETWSLNTKDLTQNQKKFTDYFKLLGDIYTCFQKELKDKNRATNGMIYKSVACNCDSYLKQINNTYFIGLNALSKAEEKIINYLVGSNKAKVIFDGDEYYTKNKIHEAGYFYRKYDFNQRSFLPNNISSKNKNFNFYTARSNQEQISYVRTILKKLTNSNSCVIYLMDENMAGSIQEHLNNKNHKVNFSMGLPINQSEVFTLIYILLDALNYKNKEKYLTKDFFHFEWVNKIISIKTIKKRIGIDFMSSKIWKNIIENNSLFINKKWIEKYLKPIDSIFKTESLLSTKNGASLLTSLKKYLNNIEHIFKENELEIYVIEQFKEIITNLVLVISNSKEDISSQLIIKVLTQEIKKINLPSSGDPYTGIQVMGFLESRMLDYENVIYLSCNESHLPKADLDHSFFPNDLKKHYELPSTYEKDALYSYYFYRSLHCTKNAHFIHIQSKSSGLNSSEKSRFINQIKLELRLENINFIDHTTNPWVNRNSISENSNKNLNNNLIERWISSGISPSSINCFSTCSLNFYNKYLLRINEEKKLENRIPPSKWGDTIHLVLEDLFHEDLLINKTSLQKMLKEYKKLLFKKFDDSYSDRRYLNGQNGLLFRQFEQCIKRLIQNEISQVNKTGEFKILHTEKLLSQSLEIPFNGKNIVTNLKGKADRIDETSAGLRIIDYKTGYFQATDTNIESYNLLFKKEKALQLAFYAYLYMKENKDIQSVSSGIISIKNPSSNKLMFTENNNEIINRDIISIFESQIIDLIGYMNNNEFEFKHNADSKYCMMC